ncbi:MAG: hypothetical protein KDA65_08025 [Planctomycetaceae bacterium]|nr:hypothetical protein [Planctomycetaceae bacterium]
MRIGLPSDIVSSFFQPVSQRHPLSLRATQRFMLLIGVFLVGLSCYAEAQQSSKGDKTQQVTIEREPLMVLKPDAYQFRFHLSPNRVADLVASTSGTIRQINAKPGEKVNAQFTLVSLDDTGQKLRTAIAAANLEVVQRQKPTDAVPAEVLQAKLELARAELELEKYKLSLTQIFVPFDSRLEQVFKQGGVYVTEGTVIARVIDESQLTVQLPLERKEVVQGETIRIQVESEQVAAQVLNISGVPENWDALRDITSSVVMVTCVIDNSSGKYHAGQTVYSPIIPRHTVAEVDLDAVSNSTEGGRQIQVIREQTVRNIKVETLAQVGTNRIFVSGLFLEGDEVVTSSSVELKEGTLVQSVFDAEEVKGDKPSKTPKRINSNAQEF